MLERGSLRPTASFPSPDGSRSYAPAPETTPKKDRFFSARPWGLTSEILWTSCFPQQIAIGNSIFESGRSGDSLNTRHVNGRSAGEISPAVAGPVTLRKRQATKTYPRFLGVFGFFSKSSCSESLTDPCIRPLGDTAGAPGAALPNRKAPSWQETRKKSSPKSLTTTTTETRYRDPETETKVSLGP